MSSQATLREHEHRTRADRHRKIGDLLVQAGDEWGAVPLFYCAFHYVKAAMLRDPIWGDVTALQSIHQDLIPEDRYVERHHGRRRNGAPREWGVNEIVLQLYPQVVKQYEVLHQASIKVRYGTGLPDGALPALTDAIDKICETDAKGGLEAALNWPRL